MRMPAAMVLLTMLLPASSALASYGNEPPPSDPTPTQADKPGMEHEPATPRAQAEAHYADGYKDIVQASLEIKRGKTQNAEKRYKRARDRFRKAVALDSTYVEAWNLIGFSSRKLGEYPASFEAYRTALRQKPLFGLAREYYGEGLLETGDLAGAKEQLMWLQRIGDDSLIDELDQAIQNYEAARAEHAMAQPDSAATAGHDSP